MSAPTSCLRCQGPMEVGYVADMTGETGLQPRPVQSAWVSGLPKTKMLSARILKTSQSDVYNTLSYRCSQCGLLETYTDESTYI